MSIPTALDRITSVKPPFHMITLGLNIKKSLGSSLSPEPAPTVNRTRLQGCSTWPWRKQIYMGTKISGLAPSLFQKQQFCLAPLCSLRFLGRFFARMCVPLRPWKALCCTLSFHLTLSQKQHVSTEQLGASHRGAGALMGRVPLFALAEPRPLTSDYTDPHMLLCLYSWLHLFLSKSL